jgi:hypothetical protein
LASDDKLVAGVREKLHVAATALSEALQLAEPGAHEELLASGITSTELHRSVLQAVEQAGKPVSCAEVITLDRIGLRWSESAVRRALLKLGHAGLIIQSTRERTGKGPADLTVWHSLAYAPSSVRDASEMITESDAVGL